MKPPKYKDLKQAAHILLEKYGDEPITIGLLVELLERAERHHKERLREAKKLRELWNNW